MIIIINVIIIILDTDVFEFQLLFRCYILALSVYILSLYLYSCSLVIGHWAVKLACK
jgi:hypothetical protein